MLIYYWYQTEKIQLKILIKDFNRFITNKAKYHD